MWRAGGCASFLLFLASVANIAYAQDPPVEDPPAPDAYAPEPPAAGDLATSPPFYPSPWGSGSGDWDGAYTKAREFVSQLTLAEKVNLTTGVGWQLAKCVGETGSVPRLNFRGLCLQDGPMGVRNADYISAFPGGLTIAATFDRGLMYQRGYAMGSEHRDKGIDVQLAPVAGPLGRMPAGGRNWEGFSPDPVLTGIGMAETVRGIQDAGVIACAKHYIANEQEHFRQAPEANTWGFENVTESLSSNIDDTTMHELYLWPFADAVRAGVGAIMCSYNQINNSYGCQNSYALNGLLKAELDFQGFVLSDWTAHHSGVGAALAGLDMSMPGDTMFDTGRAYWGPNLTLAVVNGTVPEWRLDDMVTRILAAWYKVGRDEKTIPINFDSWTADTFGPEHYFVGQGNKVINEHVDVRTEQHSRLIRDIAAKGTVLLKNEKNALPLVRPKFTAVIGQDASDDPYGPNGCPDRGCDNSTLAQGWGSGTANYPYLVSPLTAIQLQTLQDGGVFQSVTDNYADTQISSLAKQASVALVFVNSDSGEGYISIDGNIGDRNNLTLWDSGDALIKNVSAICNNTIVIMHTVGPVLVDSWASNPNVTAILWAGLPGQESGNSIVDVLYGKVNPGGKSPFTWAKKAEDYGLDVLYEPNGPVPQQDFKEGSFIDYRALDKAEIEPTYEFGFGLSYTKFSYSDLKIEKKDGAKPYEPTTGETKEAPVLGNFSTDLADYQFPEDISRVPLFIYPYLNTTDAKNSSDDKTYADGEDQIPEGAHDASPQPLLPAGGAPGGNRGLYEVLYQVSATVTNDGEVAGEEVAQLYLCLGGPNDPKVVLRGFERILIEPGESATFTADVTRRDISNWDTKAQDWVVTDAVKGVHVGSSSRKIELKGTLE
ncbi:MAG: hypothetical protein M1837_003455 [Sclerophora amabilis]|nr:MAG: hypothetical protein M1837_003455 [Sclerophora amabilis]